MKADSDWFEADDGRRIFVYTWLPDTGAPRAVVHIAHGLAEHAARYARLADALTSAGFAVYANDHRGHGRTAHTEEDLGYFAGSDGWMRVVRDLDQMIVTERDMHPGAPCVLLGHSMGSFLTQTLMYARGDRLDAAVLSGSNGKPGGLASVGRLIARLERLRLGKHGRSKLLANMTFGAFNKPFAPQRTEFDWLSRDEAEVDKYIADPLCGFEVTTQLWIDLLDGTSRNFRPGNLAGISKDVPLYLFAGERDPVGEFGKGMRRLHDGYRALGLKDVTMKLYPDGRHEMLNETNRDEVTANIVSWLDDVTS
jgi:alpha-beta hydrolase superfamily lysophospholipase